MEATLGLFFIIFGLKNDFDCLILMNNYTNVYNCVQSMITVFVILLYVVFSDVGGGVCRCHLEKVSSQ